MFDDTLTLEDHNSSSTTGKHIQLRQWFLTLGKNPKNASIHQADPVPHTH